MEIVGDREGENVHWMMTLLIDHRENCLPMTWVIVTWIMMTRVMMTDMDDDVDEGDVGSENDDVNAQPKTELYSFFSK